MPDILQLLDNSIPLQTRYDKFLDWDNQNATTVLSLIADKLEISEAAVEVFLDLGKLEDDEFDMIDQNKISIDALFFIVKEEKTVRQVIYNYYFTVVSTSTNPQRKLKDFIDEITVPDFRKIALSVTGEAYFSIAKYLKDMDIKDGTITTSFRAFIFKIGKSIKQDWEISIAQTDWIIRAITHDKVHHLNVFTNDVLKKDHNSDYLKFQQISLLLDYVN